MMKRIICHLNLTSSLSNRNSNGYYPSTNIFRVTNFFKKISLPLPPKTALSSIKGQGHSQDLGLAASMDRTNLSLFDNAVEAHLQLQGVETQTFSSQLGTWKVGHLAQNLRSLPNCHEQKRKVKVGGRLEFIFSLIAP